MFKKKLLSLAVVFALLFSFTGCFGNDKKEDSPSGSTTPTVDRSGAEITVPEKVETIVSLAPSITQTLVDLGVGDKIVAIDKYSSGIEGLKSDLPQFDMMQPDVEKLIETKANVILVSSLSKLKDSNMFDTLSKSDISLMCIPSAESIDGIKKDVQFLGQVIKNEDKANELVANMEKELDAVKNKTKDIENKKTVLFEIGSSPKLYTFGAGVYLNEMIEIAGGKNVFADQTSWVTVDPEQAISKNPDAIITNEDYIDDATGAILKRSGWENVTAVKNKDVHLVGQTYTSQPNIHIVEGVKEIAKALYPDKF